MQIDQVLLNTLLCRFLLFDFVTAILFIIEMEMWFIEFCIVLKWLAVMVSGQITYSDRYSFKCGLMTSQHEWFLLFYNINFEHSAEHVHFGLA